MQSSYTIYNASAGSGKTYGLVKAYLKIILSDEKIDSFRRLLAITFTNKAVFEMKDRVIEMLTEFSDIKSLTEANSMFEELRQELKIAPEKLRSRSESVLKHILHNYAAFNISTIDGFNHQLIRNFAFDLQLNQFFEVQLDQKTILRTAVDNLMNRAGEDAEITQLLIDFSEDKMKEDKNWDTTKELLEVAEMLTKENHYTALKELKEKTLSDFIALKKILQQKLSQSIETIRQITTDFFTLLNENDLDENIFSGKYMFNFFKKIQNDPKREPVWGANWQLNLETKPLYAESNKKGLNTALIDSLQPEFVRQFKTVQQQFGEYNFVKNALQYVVPLALLNRIQNEIELIKQEENILPIWEFNSVISNEITKQTIPFIYERIGERFQHYFIDEFQDTSELQWNNLKELISNVVSSEDMNQQQGSVLLVGDAKQSIYRWRGSKAEQFMDLYLNKKQPFTIGGIVVNLEENYRSLETIIDFNNKFFKFTSTFFESEEYQNLYANATQNYPEYKRNNQNFPIGYVDIRFVDVEQEEENYEEENIADELGYTPRELTYCKEVWETVKHANESGAKDEDITILVRKKREGLALASYLSAQGKKIISPDSLLLKNVPSIRFLISLLRAVQNPDSKELKINMLFDFISVKNTADVHNFITEYIDQPIDSFFEKYGFSLAQFNGYSLYEGMALAVNRFDLANDSDAYIASFLDIIFEFKNTNKGGISDFLLYWEENQDALSISSPEGLDAISIMTVHKSKGLSAPVIIYAFADSELVDTKKDTLWYPVDAENFGGFSHLLVRFNKGIINFETQSQEIINQHNEQNKLDQINVLYVAMTRPESFLYVITALPESPKKQTYGTLLKEFAGLHISLLNQNEKIQCNVNENQSHYTFGSPIFPQRKKLKQIGSDGFIKFQKDWKTPNYKIATGASLLWDTTRKEAIERGNLMHKLLAEIKYKSDIQKVLEKNLQNGTISQVQHELIEKQLIELLQRKEIQPYFTDRYNYYIEREFVDSNGNYFRPDRIAYSTEEKIAVIIDYKTGKPNEKDVQQMSYYANNLSLLGWNITQKILVYLNTSEIIFG
ncbi:DNA helicase UvrD [Capnocytophaga sp. H4358]|uniref:UvrD-helicase domain-containing protein n=1 Tax=Capnocytophaga sp. H4358 TaxID=1945658 RepID=UPI000BB1D9BD|nr:UvrD-helicase domain-containing protein [Capnocytophaga sp. H4358]ATA73288.1 DNA helicase UvrD [Capnocytophaga sp. H4358]